MFLYTAKYKLNTYIKRSYHFHYNMLYDCLHFLH